MKKGKKTEPVKAKNRRNGGGRKKLRSGKSTRSITANGRKKVKGSKASTSRSTTKKTSVVNVGLLQVATDLKKIKNELKRVSLSLEQLHIFQQFYKGFITGKNDRQLNFEKQVLGSITEIKTKIGLDYHTQSVKQQGIIVTEADLQRAEATAAISAPEEIDCTGEAPTNQLPPELNYDELSTQTLETT